MKYPIISGNGKLEIDSSGFVLHFGTTDIVYASANHANPLVRILYSDAQSMWLAKRWEELSPNGVAVTGNDSAVRLAFDGFGGRKVLVEVEITGGKDGFRFDARVSNNDAGVVAGLVMPCIYGFSEMSQSTLYYSDRSGQKIANPFFRFQESQAEFKYPVPLSAQFITCNTGKEGWMLSCQDSKMLYKNIRLGGKTASLAVVQYCFAQAGETTQVAAVVLTPYDGQWYTACDQYRQWFESWSEKMERSSLIECLPVISSAVIRARPVDDQYLHDVTKEMELGTYEAAIGTMEKLKDIGFEGCHIVGWHGWGHDTDYPEHKVSEAMGGREGLKKLTGRMKELGLQVGFYANGRLGNINSGIPDDIKQWAVKPDNDKDIKEKYGAEVFDILCPCGEGYIKLLERMVSELVGEYHADFIQLDQVGAAPSYLCFDRTHGHSTPASAWPEGYERMLRRLYAAGRSVNPGFWIWIEGCWEGAAQHVDLQQGGFWPYCPESQTFDELYRYTFPRHPLMGDAVKGGVPMWVGEPSKAEVALMRKFRNFYNVSSFMDRAGLEFDENLIDARWHRSGTAFLIIAKNLSGRPVWADIKLNRNLLEGFDAEGLSVKTLRDGSIPAAKFEKGYLSFTLVLEKDAVDGIYAVNN